MRVFWDNIEKLDRTVFAALDKIATMRGKPTFRAQIQEDMEKVRAPQKAITFDA